MRPRKQPSQQQKPHRVEPRLPGKAQPPPPSRPTPSTRPVDEGIIYGLYHQSTRVIPYHHCATGGKENEHSAATRHQQSSANRRKSKHFPPSRKERGGTHVRAWLAALYCRTAIFQISNSIILLSKHLNACHVASAWRQLFFSSLIQLENKLSRKLASQRTCHTHTHSSYCPKLCKSKANILHKLC